MFTRNAQLRINSKLLLNVYTAQLRKWVSHIANKNHKSKEISKQILRRNYRCVISVLKLFREQMNEECISVRTNVLRDITQEYKWNFLKNCGDIQKLLHPA
uniref:Uncharacterized protein n=1 Tax=Onchocerca volvulus TaxID=6282 RepID=A0A8R1TJ16_ONCVO